MDTTLILQIAIVILLGIAGLLLMEGRKLLLAKLGAARLEVIETALRHGIQYAAQGGKNESNDDRRKLAIDLADDILTSLGITVPVGTVMRLLESVYLRYKEDRWFMESDVQGVTSDTVPS